MAEIRKRIVFHGRVQGVGFRYTAKISRAVFGIDRLGSQRLGIKL